MPEYQDEVKAALTRLSHLDIIGRIWQEDFTVWKPAPAEIANRLGWLNLPAQMPDNVPALKAFANEVKTAGYENVVLLGMGGSSLGPEVIWRTFGNAPGFPKLIVLDSILPESVEMVAGTIDPARTLFLVSSKSGSTVEPNILYAFFREQVSKAVGPQNTGKNFVAITDPGSSLATLGKQDGFRHVFLNPANVGGRYSVLSYFGLVPAVLVGVDVAALLVQARFMVDKCSYTRLIEENQGAQLGAFMGAMADAGRDKLTLVTSPSLAGFGLWAEQLIAESTGKEGKGIVPVVGEPLADPACYRGDRAFVYLRLGSDDNAANDEALAPVGESGQPVFRIDIEDKAALGGEFFRWEFATAVAGALLEVNPFDQPDVQRSKEATERILKQSAVAGGAAGRSGTAGVSQLLRSAPSGAYVAIMAYLVEDAESNAALGELRRKILQQHHVATTLGYGPRFLHSTGQLHKGGPNSGLFVQITAEHSDPVPVPGQPFTFAAVADAQAQGDLETLQALGRKTVSVRLKKGNAAELARLLP